MAAKTTKVMVVGGLSTNSRDRKAMRKFTAYLSDEAGEKMKTCLAYLDDLCYDIAPGAFTVYDARNQVDLSDVDAVFIRGMSHLSNSRPYYLSRYCAWSKKLNITDYSLYFPADKIAQTILFLEAGVPFLRTLYCPGNRRLVAEAEHRLGYPYILKPILAAHGDSNYLVMSRFQANKVIAAEPRTDFLAQAYCPNDHDFRLLLAGDGQLLFERRGAADTHLNNTSKGAQAIKTDALPPAVIDQARHLCKRLGLTLAGVDIIPHLHTGELYFLEINVQPQLLTGAFLNEKKTLIIRLLQAV